MGFAQIQLIKGPGNTRPTFNLVVGQNKTYTVSLFNDDGTAKDLSMYVPEDATPVSETCPPGDYLVTTGVQVNIAEYQGQYKPTASAIATITEGPDECTKDTITFTFDQCDITCPGMYMGEVLLLKDGKIDDIYRFNLEVESSLNFRVNGPLTISEIRLWVRDSSPDDNFLLDEHEYKDSEIVAAINRGVDTWNTEPPFMSRHMYTPLNFPFRGPWIQVTVGYLMSIAAHWYLRNHLPYQAAGLSVDDKNKYQFYRQEAKERIDGYRNWVKEAKLQMNTQQMWGSSKVFYPSCSYGAGRYHYYGLYSY